MFNAILVALDTSEDCSLVFNQALDQAKSTGAVLKLLGVIAPANSGIIPLTAYSSGFAGYPVIISDEVWEAYQKRYATYKERCTAALTRFAEQATAVGVQAEVMLEEDTPGRAICDRAKSESADLIFVGSHGRKGLSEIFMGSVSNYVMHHAPCSVLVVHTPSNNPGQIDPSEKLSDWEPGRYTRIKSI